MKKHENRTSDVGSIQVFELTTDNPEDQDELNRRLQKPGEAEQRPPAKIGRTEQRKAAMESAE